MSIAAQSQDPQQSGRRICLITGGNAGIGFAAAQQLVAAGHDVVIGCRDPERGATALAQLRAGAPGAAARLLALDVSSRASIEAAAGALDAVDVVVHNAAFFDISQTTRALSIDGVELTWATNHLGPALLTELLLPKLRRAGGRVIAVTSKGLALNPWRAVDLDDVEFARRGAQRFSVPQAYYQSKLAHLTWMLALAAREPQLRVHGVRVTNVKLDITRYPNVSPMARKLYALKSRFSISPAEMAKTYTWLATEPGLATRASGGYWDDVEVAAPISRWARDGAHQDALWSLTRRQLGLP